MRARADSVRDQVCGRLWLRSAQRSRRDCINSAIIRNAKNIFDHIQRARAHANNNRRRTREIRLANFEARIFERHHGRRVGKLRVPRHPFWFQFRLDVVVGIKIFYFTGNPTFQVARVKQRDRTDAALAGDERFPKFFVSGNDDAISLHCFWPPRAYKPLAKTVGGIATAKTGELAVN